MLSSPCHTVVGQLDELPDPRVNNRVVDETTVLSRGHIAAPSQTPEMVRDAALRQARASHQIADTQLSIKELLQDTHP